MRRRLCIFTGSRAEYGLLRPLIVALRQEKAFDVRLLVSGTHMSREFGMTYRHIVHDGVTIDAKVKMMDGDDSPAGIARAMGKGLGRFTEILTEWRPDMVLLLGDRFETLAMAQAAMLTRIPIGHLYGGELTLGAIDEAIRHAITKMSHLHFTSTQTYRSRVIQLGEAPERVFNVGALGIDNIRQLKLLTREELERETGFTFGKRNLLITFHPATLHPGQAKKQFGALLKALDGLRGTRFIFTKANADMEGRQINAMIEKYVRKHKDKAVVFPSLGQRIYLSAMKYADAVVGNSSSGIIEAPSFKIGTINIGDRQAGRVRSGSVIDCSPVKGDIERSFKRLYSAAFQRKLKETDNPYGRGDAASKIVHILKRLRSPDMLIKRFYDIRIF